MSDPKAGAVVVVGASHKPERYSHRAMQMLLAAGYTTIPVHPAYDELLGLPVVHHIRDIQQAVDTVTLYINAAGSSAIIQDLIALRPKRVIFNPGSENPLLERALDEAAIAYEKACTLVLLRTGQF